jgi:hypothetical protein
MYNVDNCCLKNNNNNNNKNINQINISIMTQIMFIILKCPLCLKNAIIFISQKLFLFLVSCYNFLKYFFLDIYMNYLLILFLSWQSMGISILYGNQNTTLFTFLLPLWNITVCLSLLSLVVKHLECSKSIIKTLLNKCLTFLQN